MSTIPIILTLTGEEAITAGFNSIASAAGRMASSVQGHAGRINSAFLGTSVRLNSMPAQLMKFNDALKTSGDTAQARFGAIADAGSTIRNVGLGLMGAGGALGFLGVKATQSAGQVQMWEIAFAKMMGSADAGHAKLQELSDFAAKTPFTMQGLVPEAQKLMAMGFSADEVIPTLGTLGDAMAGLGQGEDVLDRVVYNLGQVRAQGHATAADLRQFAMAGINIGETMRRGTGKTMTQEEMTSMKAEDFIPAFQKGLQSQFGGMMEAQNKTLPGQVSNLTDQLFRLGAVLGAQLAPSLTVVVSLVTGVVGFFTHLPEPLQKIIAWGGALTAGLLLLGGGFLAIAGMAAGAIVPLLTLSGAMAAEGVAATGLTVALGGGLAALGAALLPIIGTVALVVAGAVALGAALYGLWKGVTWLWDKATGADKAKEAEKEGAKLDEQNLKDLNEKRAKKGLAPKTMQEFQEGIEPAAKPTAQPPAGAGAMDIPISAATQGATTYSIDGNVASSTSEGKVALEALDAQIGSARAKIEALQDQVHATKEKGAKALAQEELRMAQRDLQHLTRARSQAAKDERLAKKIADEALKVQEMRAKVSAAQQDARSDLEKEGRESSNRIRAAQDKSRMEGEIKEIEAQQKAGLLGKTDAQSRIDAIKAAYERRDRAMEADSKLQQARIEAQSIMAEARIKAGAQKGEEAKTTLALGKIQADKVMKLAQLGVKEAAALNAIEANKPKELTSSQRILQALGRGGSVYGLPRKGANGELTPVGGAGGSTLAVGAPTEGVNARGQKIIQFPPLVINDPWSDAARAYGR